MSHLKVWFFCASVLSPSLAFSGHSSMDLLNRYCRLFQEDSWSRLRLVDAQNMVREKSVRDTVERVLHLGAASIRTEPKVQVEGSSRLGREHIAAFLVHFFPFELAESHQTLRGDRHRARRRLSSSIVNCVEWSEFKGLLNLIRNYFLRSWTRSQLCKTLVRDSPLFLGDTSIKIEFL